MEKITENRAIQLISLGIFPKCEVERGVLRPIKSYADLEKYKNLSSIQGFILWGYTNEEIADFAIPDSAIKISLDESIRMIIDGEPIYGKSIAEPEVLFTSRRELLDFYKKSLNTGDSFYLFWKG